MAVSIFGSQLELAVKLVRAVRTSSIRDKAAIEIYKCARIL